MSRSDKKEIRSHTLDALYYLYISIIFFKVHFQVLFGLTEHLGNHGYISPSSVCIVLN